MKIIKKVLFGIILICIGVIMGLNTLKITHIDIFFDGWWTLFIIVPCLFGLFSDNDKMGNLIGIFIGVVLLLGCQDLIDFDVIWKLMVPFILVVIGFSIVFKGVFHKHIDDDMKHIFQYSQNHQEYNAVFGKKEIHCDHQHFEGAKLNSVFGSIDLDLRQAYLDHDVVIQASAIFGGMTIFVPDQINVKLNASSVFGGVDNDHRFHDSQGLTVYIDATCVFGGINIK